jgi:hypothetical protein
VANLPENMTEGDEQEVEDGQAAQAGQPSSSPALKALKANGVLASLFVAAAIGIYFFSIKKGPSEASAKQSPAELQVDSAILRLRQPTTGPSESADTEQLIKSFYSDLAKRQVPLSALKKNPFVFVPPTAPPLPVTTAPVDDSGPRLAAISEREAHDRAMATLKTLTLQSIVMGKEGGTAIISNNLLTVGQKIEDFTIKSISPKSVVLTFQGKDYPLYMP